MLQKVILDSDKFLLPDKVGNATTRTLKRSRRVPVKHVKSKRRLNKKQILTRPLLVNSYTKWLEMQRKDRNDIERNKVNIKAIASFLHNILQLPHTPADTVPPHPNIDQFMTPKRTIRHMSVETSSPPDIKDEEVVEGNDDSEGGTVYGDLASLYLKPFLSTRGPSDVNHYGIRRYGDNFMIGDSVITVDRESNLTIKGKHYKGTKGLWELLTRKDVNNNVITESDLKRYKTILETTNAHLEGFEPGNDILIVRGPKFSKVISKLFPQTKRSVHWVTY